MGTHSSTEQSRTRVRIMCSGVGQHYTLEDPKSVWQLRRQRMDTLSKLLESIHFTFMKKYANLLTEFFPSLVLSKYEKKAKFVTRIMKEHLWNPLNVLLEIIMVFFMEWKPARNYSQNPCSALNTEHKNSNQHLLHLERSSCEHRLSNKCRSTVATVKK